MYCADSAELNSLPHVLQLELHPMNGQLHTQSKGNYQDLVPIKDTTYLTNMINSSNMLD